MHHWLVNLPPNGSADELPATRRPAKECQTHHAFAKRSDERLAPERARRSAHLRVRRRSPGRPVKGYAGRARILPDIYCKLLIDMHLGCLRASPKLSPLGVVLYVNNMHDKHIYAGEVTR